MANIYNLLDFTAHTDGLLDLCAERGISVVVGGPFASVRKRLSLFVRHQKTS